MSQLQVAGFLDNSAVNGEGLRSVVFLSGCHHYCPGCHNKDMQDPHYGEALDHTVILRRIKDNMPIIKGVTISGGEPFLQCEPLLTLLREIKDLSLSTWVYTGYTYEQISADANLRKLLAWIDVLVEGPFVEALLTTDLPYLGSVNQRILQLSNGMIQEERHYP